MGLAVRAGAPHPDISTVEKLAAVLKSAKAVMRSNPAGGSMVASVIENNVIKRPQFAGVNSPVSTKGEGGQALARGEGDMAIQAICEILPYKEIELVGPLPRELAAWIRHVDGRVGAIEQARRGDEVHPLHDAPRSDAAVDGKRDKTIRVVQGLYGPAWR